VIRYYERLERSEVVKLYSRDKQIDKETVNDHE